MWDAIIGFLYNCIADIEHLLGDWGLAIILFTAIIRLILFPLTYRQQKSTANMQALTPMLQDIQKRYADDRQKMNEEMSKFYSEHKFNPLSGCLPMLIQMPVFFALFSVLRNRVPEDASFFNILPTLSLSASDMLTDSGFVAAIPYIVFVLLFGILTFLPMFLQGNSNNSTRIMGIVMTIVMLFVGWSSPAGVVLYWVVSSAWSVLQQQVIMRWTKGKIEAEQAAEVAKRPVEVDVVRKVQKPRPKKKH